MGITGRAAAIAVLLCLFGALPDSAANPDDVSFVLRLTKSTPVYHTGEVIEFEISYSSTTEKKYHGTFTTPDPDVAVVTLHLSPMGDAFDRRRLHESDFAGSILSGNGDLGSQPMTTSGDLAKWYRFDKPGHYTLMVTSPEISRVKSFEEGGGVEPLTLESNPVDFDILPRDAAWESQELWSIENILENKPDSTQLQNAYHRLAMLDTPGAARKLVQLYLASADGSADSHIFHRALRESSNAGVIVPLLDAALSDPMVSPPANSAQLLADLQVIRQLGPPPEQPPDAASLEAWQKKLQERQELRERYLARANDLVLASIRRRSGPQRAAAIYDAWYNEEQLNKKPDPPARLAQLRFEMVGLAKDLPRSQQSQFVALAWPHLDHELLRPVVRDLALKHEDIGAFQFWCESWPDDCATGIVGTAMKADSRLPPFIVLLLPEAEHPELDTALMQRLKPPAFNREYMTAARISALVLRAGSRNLLSAVTALFSTDPAKPPNCEAQGYLIGYLSRTRPEDAAKLLGSKLWDKNDNCAGQLFYTLKALPHTDDLVPIAVKALNSPVRGVAGSAALFLGEHGPISVQDALWQRLNLLWKLWHDRKAELRSAAPGDQDVPALLEQQLASALAHAANWKLTSEQQDQLHESCLTDQCRTIAEGKMYMN
ncbi:MAG TPA: hypothetical protein VJN43_11730 [Bryobacteraceae bacterium]|nr:hypothetical protein [Bryobacteraceae bacterium]